MTDSPLDIAVLLDDPELLRLVAVWPKLSKEQRADSNVIAMAANIPRNNIHEIVYRAEINNLIKPDGTINSYAEKYLSTLIAERLKKNIKK